MHLGITLFGKLRVMYEYITVNFRILHFAQIWPNVALVIIKFSPLSSFEKKAALKILKLCYGSAQTSIIYHCTVPIWEQNENIN